MLFSNAVQTDASRSASARSFLHSLNILIKYTRLYGMNHKRTEGQFETAWNELQRPCPKPATRVFVLGVSDNKLLLDGIPLETGQAERSFAQLLNAAGLSSILFSNKVTLEDFTTPGACLCHGRLQGAGFRETDQGNSRRKQGFLDPHQ